MFEVNLVLTVAYKLTGLLGKAFQRRNPAISIGIHVICYFKCEGETFSPTRFWVQVGHTDSQCCNRKLLSAWVSDYQLISKDLHHTTCLGWVGEETTTVLQTVRARKKSRMWEISAASCWRGERMGDDSVLSFTWSWGSGTTAHS